MYLCPYCCPIRQEIVIFFQKKYDLIKRCEKSQHWWTDRLLVSSFNIPLSGEVLNFGHEFNSTCARIDWKIMSNILYERYGNYNKIREIILNIYIFLIKFWLFPPYYICHIWKRYANSYIFNNTITIKNIQNVYYNHKISWNSFWWFIKYIKKMLWEKLTGP